jgi:predicted membrane protein
MDTLFCLIKSFAIILFFCRCRRHRRQTTKLDDECCFVRLCVHVQNFFFVFFSIVFVTGRTAIICIYKCKKNERREKKINETLAYCFIQVRKEI